MKKINLLIAVFAVILKSSLAQPSTVWTQRYDNKRLGWTDKENILNTSNVNPGGFGMVFTRVVDDQIYAQPLVISGMQINGGMHNVVFVATVNNTVYAFDAEDSATVAPYWQVSLNAPGTRAILNTDMTGACGGSYLDFSGHMGIVGTPVIDTTTSTMYVVSRDYVIATGKFEQYIHALDIVTGAERPNSPSYITAYYIGNGQGSVNDTIYFEEQRENQRPGLLLLNGVVYASWASHCDWTPYHGWMIGFDATTLQVVHRYNNTPDGSKAGIWMSGTAPAVDDSGFIYITTGNGTVGTFGNPNYYRDRGESITKLYPSGDTMAVSDFFTPANYAYLNTNDLDYGVDGPLLIPNSTLVLSGTKEGKLYVNDVNHMGKYSAGNDSVVQILVANYQNIFNTHIHGTPVYARYSTASGDSECVYVWAESDSIRQFFYNRNLNNFDTTLTVSGNILLDDGMPGSMLSVSSNGTTNGSGIVWASHPLSGNANQQVRPGRFMALDARNVQHLLWSSEMIPNRDSVGSFAKFNTPVVANGKVYLATFSNRLNVYGLLNHSTGIGSLPATSLFASIYPNPVERTITLSYSVSEKWPRLGYELTDIYGRKLMHASLNSDPGGYSVAIDLPENISAGIYQFMLVSDGRVIKVMKVEKY